MTDHAAHIRSALDMTETWDTYTQGVSKEYRDAALAALAALEAELAEAKRERERWRAIACNIKDEKARAESAEARVKELEAERDAVTLLATDPVFAAMASETTGVKELQFSLGLSEKAQEVTP